MRTEGSSGTVLGMRRLLSCLAVLAAVSRATAQVPPPPATPSNAPESDDLEADDLPRKATTPEPSKVPVQRSDLAPLPPPADPRMDEQEPRPVFGAASRDEGERHLEFGPDVGIWSRPAKGDQVSYAPGFAYGLHARVEVFSFLGVRAYFNNSTHAVEIPRGALGLGDTQIDQPDLAVFQLGARAEPTYMPMPTLRLWAGVGVAWARATAPEPSSTGANQIRYADRSGVVLEYSAALGATWDVVPRWLAATLSVSGGILSDPSGDLFHAQPVNDGAGGTARLQGFPAFESSLAAQLGVGMLL